MIPYSLEGLVIDRLKATLDSSWLILRSAGLEKVSKQFNHAIYVVSHEFNVTGRTRNQVKIDESVLVVTAVRNAGSQVTGELSRFEAGPMLVGITNALLGWVPEDSCEHLQMVNPPNPEFEAGFGFYPLVFKTSYVLNGVSL